MCSESRGFRLLRAIELEQPVDAVLFCPRSERNDTSTLLVAGCYKYDERERSRSGELRLLQVASDGDGLAIRTVWRRSLPWGVLDFQWQMRTGNNKNNTAGDSTSPLVLLVARSDGAVSAFALEGGPDITSYHLCELAGVDLARGIALSVAACQDGDLLVCGTDDGFATLCRIERICEAKYGMSVVGQWKAHEEAAWAASWVPGSTNWVLTGGDDAILRLWDVRGGVAAGSCGSGAVAQVAGVSRAHTAGVCCIQFHPCIEHLFATGSYDERVRLFDIRQLRNPVHEVNVGGGVWRIAWRRPIDGSPARDALLCAAMHGGLIEIELGSDHEQPSLQNALVVRGVYSGHTSLVYDCSWCEANVLASAEASCEQLAASCSFYDCQIHLLKLGV